MARPRRQYRDISRLYHDLMAVFTSQHQPGATAGEAENLVSGGMIVMKVIHAISPLRGPSVPTKFGLHLRSQLFGRSIRHGAINQNRKIRIVGHPAIK